MRQRQQQLEAQRQERQRQEREARLFLLHQSRFEEAAQILNKALELDSTRQEARLNLALCDAALERKAEAAVLARQVSANSPEGEHIREEADRLVAALG